VKLYWRLLQYLWPHRLLSALSFGIMLLYALLDGVSWVMFVPFLRILFDETPGGQAEVARWLEAPAPSWLAEPGAATANAAASDTTTGGAAASASTLLRTGAELYDFATAPAAPPTGQSDEFADPTCPQPDGASFRGVATYVGGDDPVVVEVFLVNGTARAVDAETCAVVVEAMP